MVQLSGNVVSLQRCFQVLLTVQTLGKMEVHLRIGCFSHQAQSERLDRLIDIAVHVVPAAFDEPVPCGPVIGLRHLQERHGGPFVGG